MNNISVLGNDCCGCKSCGQICPKKCINFKPDKEGFWYPVVDESVCVNCGACVKHCPLLTDVSRGENPEVYAAKYNDRAMVSQSTSGGVFAAIARKVFAQNGVVFGCAYDEKLVAKHIAVESEAELARLQGSKYVQSDTEGTYSEVRKQLKNGRQVLFSGTGCQVAGLKAFLGKSYDNLLTVDIVCHGVPSPALFQRYLEYKGKKMGGKITSYNFRSKEKSGWSLFYKADTENKSKSEHGFFDPYYSAFLKCKIYRESCYKCRYANSNRPGDITLADYWGIEKLNPEFYDKTGVSLVLINSERGAKVWKELSGELDTLKSTLENAVKMNTNLAFPSARPACRDSIYEGFDTGDFETYAKDKLSTGSTWKFRMKMLVPVLLKGKIKHMLGK